jgi:general secretion pathway protein G
MMVSLDGPAAMLRTSTTNRCSDPRGKACNVARRDVCLSIETMLPNSASPHPALAVQPRRLASPSPRWRSGLASPSPRFRSGFTLIELMVVLVIIGVLAALIVPNVLGRADDARVTAARTDVNNLMQSLKLYRLDNQRYPTSEQGLQALIAKPTSGPIPPNWKPYLEKLPKDPWGGTYQYANPGVKGEIDVFSFGADGQAGGEGNNADVGSWQ